MHEYRVYACELAGISSHSTTTGTVALRLLNELLPRWADEAPLPIGRMVEKSGYGLQVLRPSLAPPSFIEPCSFTLLSQSFESLPLMLFLELTVEVVEALRGVADTREKS